MGCIVSRVDIEANGRQYHIKRLIASGGFSQIFSAEDLESGERVAIKRITCHFPTEIERTHREIDLHCRFASIPVQQEQAENNEADKNEKDNYSYLMPILGYSKENHSKLSSNVIIFSLVFPLCKLGSMQDELTIRRLTKKYIYQKKVMHLFRQVCSAIEVFHSTSPPIAHRDLKPANLLLRTENHLLLTDFGSATECPIQIEDAKKRRIVLDESSELCTMPYRAPELFTCETGTIIDESVDIWSLGCVLYAFCYFCSPFDEVHERGDSVALAVQSARLKFDPKSPYDESMTSLISSLVKINPKERLRISELLHRLSDAF